MKSIALGSDPNAAGLKDVLKKHLTELGYAWDDYGSDDAIYANVAIDVALSAIRLGGVEEVHMVCLEGRFEMPAWEHEIQDARCEVGAEDGRVVAPGELHGA